MLRYLILAFVGPVIAVGGAARLPWQPKHHGRGPKGPAPVFSASFSTSATPEKGPSATFTRATTSTKCVDGTVSSVSSGSAVIGQPVASGGTCSGESGVYVGAAATFLLLQNEAIDNTAWTKVNSPTITANAAVAPDGATTADRVAPGGGPAAVYQALGATCGSGATCTCHAWMKTASGAASVQTCITNNAGNACRGTPVTHSITTEWQRFAWTAASDASDTNPLCYIGSGSTWTSGEEVDLWRPNGYAKSFPLPLDPSVAGSAVTKNFDNLSYADAISSVEAGTYCSWVNVASTGTARPIVAWDSTDNLYFQIDSSNRLEFATADLADNASVISSTTISANTWTHVCAAWDQAAADVRLYKNGTEVSYSGTPDRAWTAGGTFGTTMEVSQFGSAAIEGFQSRAALYPKAITASNVSGVYNGQSSLYAWLPEPLRYLFARMEPQPAWTMEGAR